ncbi:1973_t:CDS:1 [Gigaspora margarita]|uniref:1973_t:CDS:1 n=1 Tax=Gigaspora margarita TaxID=4874 RepID=A0ABN7V3H3_GIGMA|nr:1973_t:CDS:1 [Gigaspora margarita]
MIRIPDNMVIPWKNEYSIQLLIKYVYSDPSGQYSYFTDRAILTTKNEHVDYINNIILNQVPGETITYRSYNSVSDNTQGLYQQEFLNSITPNGLLPHKLCLKVGSPIMCLHNLDPTNGLCNRMRLICRSFHLNLIEAMITTGNCKGNVVFLPHIPLIPSENIKLPFILKRRQFSIRLAFALTINKSQGQTISCIGVYLPEHVFTHGQLYIAFSRAKSQRDIKVLVKNGKISGKQGTFMCNVIYKEILEN